MELTHIIAFICGGLISSIIFYPRPNKKERVEYLSTILSYQFYCGISQAQKTELPKIQNDDHLNFVALSNRPIYENQAIVMLKTMEKL
jgi:hypothetical protein